MEREELIKLIMRRIYTRRIYAEGLADDILHSFSVPKRRHPPPKEVAKIQTMLRQVETWINAGETELAKQDWILIADECRKYGT